MINSLCGSMGSLQGESSCSKLMPTTCNDTSISESRDTTLPSDSEENGLPSSLNFLQCLKFEEMEVMSPEQNSLWESIFSDQLDTGDFMISSPIRTNFPSPPGKVFNYNDNYNYAHQTMHLQSLLGCSPPRALSPLGPYNNNNKGKGLSPLHRVFNTSPNNNQFMQVESLSLPALENFLDDYEQENELLSSYSTMNRELSESSSQCYDSTTAIPALLDCFTIPNSSRFCGPGTSNQAHKGNNQEASQDESDVYEMGSLLQQLEEERQQEKQKQEQQCTPSSQRGQHLQLPQNVDLALMIPLSVGPEQVEPLSGAYYYYLRNGVCQCVFHENLVFRILSLYKLLNIG